MTGGDILGNTSISGGGVAALGTFTMSGASSVSGNNAYARGAGVYVAGYSGSFKGSFTMNAGTITYNYLNLPDYTVGPHAEPRLFHGGAGVAVDSTTADFTKINGTITGADSGSARNTVLSAGFEWFTYGTAAYVYTGTSGFKYRDNAVSITTALNLTSTGWINATWP